MPSGPPKSESHVRVSDQQMVGRGRELDREMKTWASSLCGVHTVRCPPTPWERLPDAPGKHHGGGAQSENAWIYNVHVQWTVCWSAHVPKIQSGGKASTKR